MDATKVTASKPSVAGAVSCGKVGTTLPKNATEKLNEGFKKLGYISEDGLTNTNSPTCESVKAWGGNTVLNVQTEKQDQYKFTLIEALNEDVLKTVYGEKNVTGSLEVGLTITANSNELDAAAWVVDTILKGGYIKRSVIPRGKISAVGDIVYKDNAAVGYPITLTLEPDENGNTHYEYIQKGSEA